MGFFIEVLISGLMAGVLYSLVALGFVLIFKASGVFNFAQGAMVLFAALTFVRLLDILSETFAPILLSLALTIGVMIVLAIAVERLLASEFHPEGKALGEPFDLLLGIGTREAEHHHAGENADQAHHHQHFNQRKALRMGG